MKKIVKKIAFVSFLLFLVAGTIAYVVFDQGSFSEADLRVEIIGPEEVSVGETVDYKIRYRNNSDIRLEDVSVTFQYPETAVPIQEDEDEVVEQRESLRRVEELNDINPGEEEIINFKAKIFGEERDAVEALAWFNYSPQNLSADYEIERSHTGIITEVPLSFEFDLPDQIEKDEEFPFRVRYFSQLEEGLENLGVRLDYPSDFEFVRSTPRGLEDNQWEREFLGGNEGAVIEIFGKLGGEEGDIKGFKGELGIWKFDRFITLKRIEGEVLIPQPDLFIDIIVNDSPDHIANPGEDLLYDIYFKNIGDQTIEDLFLTVDLDTEILNMNETEPMGGRFQPNAGSIIWSHSSFSELRRLRPDDEEKLSFWSKVNENDLPYNPEAVVSLSMNNSREESRVKINTVMEMNQRFIVGEEDPFESEGPLPLELNRPSTYTVNWEIKNHYNDLEDVKVTSRLPEDAGIIDRDYFEDSEFEFDSDTGEITWKIEEVEGGAGISRNPPRANFQVEIIPVSSTDEEVELIGETEVSGIDTWTEEELVETSRPLFHIDLLEEAEIDFDSDPEEIEFEEDEE